MIIAAILKFIDGVPGIIWAAIVAVLLAMLAAAGVHTLVVQRAYEKEVVEHSKTKVDFSTFVAEVEKAAREAREEKGRTEIANFRNAERVASEQDKRDKAAAASVARLRGNEQRMRDELETFRAAAERDARAGDTAALAAKAATLGELYGACRDEYREMAIEAEAVRTQAIGLWEYVRGNSMCSTRFGPDVPEPAK